MQRYNSESPLTRWGKFYRIFYNRYLKLETTVEITPLTQWKKTLLTLETHSRTLKTLFNRADWICLKPSRILHVQDKASPGNKKPLHTTLNMQNIRDLSSFSSIYNLYPQRSRHFVGYFSLQDQTWTNRRAEGWTTSQMHSSLTRERPMHEDHKESSIFFELHITQAGIASSAHTY